LLVVGSARYQTFQEDPLSDSYEALVDCRASAEQARSLAPVIVQTLSRSGLIVPEPSPDCVFDGAGYPAGPKCAEAYIANHRDIRFWKLRTSGVEIHCEPWVNIGGFTQFDSARCPRCDDEHGTDFLDDVGNLVQGFLDTGVVPRVACRSCKAASLIHEWQCDPHLGFVHLAVVFWNWASFVDENWRIDVPALLADHLKRPLVLTHGRM
jgi:hypothetical protein